MSLRKEPPFAEARLRAKADATKKSSFLLLLRFKKAGASRSLSSGAHSRGPLARNDDFARAVMHPYAAFPSADIGGQYGGYERQRPHIFYEVGLHQAEDRANEENHRREGRRHQRQPVAPRRGRDEPERGIERRDQG